MNFVSIGDQAQTYLNLRHNVQVKSDLARLAQELASGQKADIYTSVAGDFAPLISLERSRKANMAYTTATIEAGLFATAMQTSLEQVQTHSLAMAPNLLMAGSSQSELVVAITTEDAKSKMEAVIAAINTRVADRYAFSGTATDRPPLANADTMLADLKIAIAAETTALGVEAAVDVWFDAVGGGFDTIGYTGSATTMSPFRLSDTDTVDLKSDRL